MPKIHRERALGPYYLGILTEESVDNPLFQAPDTALNPGAFFGPVSGRTRPEDKYFADPKRYLPPLHRILYILQIFGNEGLYKDFITR